MIEEGFRLAVEITEKIEQIPLKDQLKKLELLQQNCHQRNYKYFFFINKKHSLLL